MNNSQPPPETLSVSQLNRQVKRLLESHFDYVWVEGELSNLATPASGHWYFSLKDASSQVRCAMFRNRNQRIRMRPENGQQIRIRARVSLYEGRGDYQLIAEHMEPAGDGALQLAFEQLKKQLQAEGLFAAENKQPLPDMPGHIGVITSPSGAAVRDILSVFRRRFPGIDISILPVPVQGDDAAPAIVAAIELANRAQSEYGAGFDALVLARGGGSMEDLWAFNDERVARAIAASELPLVSAVGHEVDFTIADFAADVRAPTPSAAAELLSPDQREMLQDFKSLQQSLLRGLRRRLADASRSVQELRRHLRHPGERLQEQAQRLDECEQRLQRGLRRNLSHQQQRLAILQARLHSHSPGDRIERTRLALQNLEQRLEGSVRAKLERQQQRLARNVGLLNSISPLATLERGYAMVTDASDRIVRDADQLRPGDQVTTRLAKGDFRSRVLDDD